MKKKSLFLKTIILFIVLSVGCKKDNPAPQVYSYPVIYTANASGLPGDVFTLYYEVNGSILTQQLIINSAGTASSWTLNFTAKSGDKLYMSLSSQKTGDWEQVLIIYTNTNGSKDGANDTQNYPNTALATVTLL